MSLLSGCIRATVSHLQSLISTSIELVRDLFVAMTTWLAMGLTALALGSASAQSDWNVGRATFYGTDGWSIHQESCGFYYIFQVC